MTEYANRLIAIVIGGLIILGTIGKFLSFLMAQVETLANTL